MALEAFRPMSYACPRCGVRLVDDAEDPACDYELEGAQVRHTVKRCAEVVDDSTKPLRPSSQQTAETRGVKDR